jgi:hypothetical protein
MTESAATNQRFPHNKGSRPPRDSAKRRALCDLLLRSGEGKLEFYGAGAELGRCGVVGRGGQRTGND